MKKITLFFTFSLFTILCLSAQENGTCTWSGNGGDTNWTTAANWSNCNSSYPSGGAAIAKITGNNATQTITLNADITLNQFEIMGSATGGTITIQESGSSSLTFNGSYSKLLKITRGGMTLVFNCNVNATKGQVSREMQVGKDTYGSANTLTFGENYTFTLTDDVEFTFTADASTDNANPTHTLNINGTVVSGTHDGSVAKRRITFGSEHEVVIGQNADFSNWQGDITITGDNTNSRTSPYGLTVNGPLNTRGLDMSGVSSLIINTTGSVLASGSGSSSGQEVRTTGTGKVVVKTSNSSSGSFMAKNASHTVNISFQRSLDQTNGNSATEWTLIGIPVAGETLADLESEGKLATNGLKVGLGYFDNATGQWTTYSSGASVTLTQMKGYHATPANSGTSITLEGTMLQSGWNTYSVNIESGDNGNWALIGNPFPTYLRMTDDASGGGGQNDFLSDNLTGNAVDNSSFAAVYAWDGEQYVPYTQSTNSKNYIAPGEGFFIYLKDGSSSRNVRFRESYQVVAQGANFNSGFARGAELNERTILELGIKSILGNQADKTKIFFSEDATVGLDPGQDLGKFPFGSATYISTKLVNGDHKDINYMWQDLPKSEINNTIVPLNISSKHDELILSVNESNLSELINLFIEDKQNNTIKKFDQRLKLEYDPNQDQSDRYYLHLTDQLIPELPTDDNLRIYKGLDSDVMVMGSVGKNYSAKVYDYSGRLIKEVNFNHKTKINDLDSKMKILRIESDEGLTIKKFKLN